MFLADNLHAKLSGWAEDLITVNPLPCEFMSVLHLYDSLSFSKTIQECFSQILCHNIKHVINLWPQMSQPPEQRRRYTMIRTQPGSTLHRAMQIFSITHMLHGYSEAQLNHVALCLHWSVVTSELYYKDWELLTFNLQLVQFVANTLKSLWRFLYDW